MSIENPQIGDIKSSQMIGKKYYWRKYMWVACIDCKEERWVTIRKGKPAFIRCKVCANKYRAGKQLGSNHPNWRGGKYKNKDGYILITLNPEDFYFPMTQNMGNGRVFEHRLVMAKSLGRCLQSWEFVHHKNGIKDDNRIENLELTTKGAHSIAHSKGYQDGYLKGLYDGHEKRIKQLESRVTQLEAENVILKTQLEQPCYQP